MTRKKIERPYWPRFPGLITTLGLLAACAAPAGTMTPAPSPTAAPAEEGNQISILEIGLTFEIPPGWQRQGEDWIWVSVSSSGPDGQRIGVNWKDIKLGQEAEALLLPNNSVMLDRTPGPALTWGTAAIYRLQVMVPGGQGQVEAVEMHVIVRGADKYYDFYASAPSDEELKALEPVLQHTLASAILSD